MRDRAWAKEDLKREQAVRRATPAHRWWLARLFRR
jgi:hypothetical protein